MQWSDEHDTLLCREILAVDPFEKKKGTTQRGEKWKTVADNLMAIAQPKFKVESRSVRDRYRLLCQKVKRKLEEEKKASGIETDMKEWETAIENLMEKEEEADSANAADSERKIEAKQDDRQTAEGIRKRAMERLQKGTKNDNDENDERPKKRRSNGNDTLMYLREKNESLEKFKIQEIEMKQKEIALQEKKHDDFMRLMVNQQQLQVKQMQDFQAMMLTMLTRMSQK